MENLKLPKLAQQRLLQHAAFMAKQKRHQRNRRFHMGVFFDENECGTVACAAGYVKLNPKFKGARVGTRDGYFLSRKFLLPKVDRELFAIAHNELFSGCLCYKIKTPAQWARVARRFVKAHS